jgi:hypothetical protein
MSFNNSEEKKLINNDFEINNPIDATYTFNDDLMILLIDNIKNGNITISKRASYPTFKYDNKIYKGNKGYHKDILFKLLSSQTDLETFKNAFDYFKYHNKGYEWRDKAFNMIKYAILKYQ